MTKQNSGLAEVFQQVIKTNSAVKKAEGRRQRAEGSNMVCGSQPTPIAVH
ncbi:MAG: hypothetical protein V7K27_03065 [Nostoc sp.]